ncbi:hypothetical protein [Chitinophaga sp.]|uniref:hypothetical protein n=1 Tax=Chitinophaga sp. TaxID=1869181 RepID=UPI00261201E8|nr:hypothetical protein [uncultured Chitinophaga sp.]
MPTQPAVIRHERQIYPSSLTEVRIDIPASVPDGMYQLMIINGPVKRHNILLLR